MGFGVSDEATANGYYIADLSVDVTAEEVFVPNHLGADIAVALFNAQATITGNGVLVNANNPHHIMYDTVGLSSAGEAIYGNANLGGGATFSESYVTQLSLRNANKDFQQGNFTAVARTGITDATGTPIA